MNYVHNLALHFRGVVQRHADKPALVYPGRTTVTFGELDARSNRLARLLRAEGIRQGDVVALFNDKSPTGFAAILAVLKLGAIYTHLDPDSPWERIRKIVETCQPRCILNLFAELPAAVANAGDTRLPVLSLQGQTFEERLGAQGADEPAQEIVITGADPAYIMFTSGSTGYPKGAVMSHANVLNFIAWAQDCFALTPADVLTNVNPIYFDNSVFDFYASLFNGAAMAPLTAAEVRDPRTLVSLVNRAGCTVWFSVPSLLVYLLTTRALGPADFPAIRKIIFGGEGFPKTKLKQLFDLYGGRADFENVYGPTECTCICSSYRVGPADFADLKTLAPLGYLAPNFDYEILPQDPANPELGELWLRGPNVGLGYYNDPERTARSFVQNPRHTRYRDIGYKTGDLVRRDGSGHLHFMGRVDFQIKHMGYRIELEEIEAALNSVPGVDEAAAVYRRLGDGMGQIIAFVASRTGRDGAHFVDRAAAIVPPYMVPKQVRVLSVLPKNQNGKIDRVALQNLLIAS